MVGHVYLVLNFFCMSLSELFPMFYYGEHYSNNSFG